MTVEEKIAYLLKLLADRRNWKFETTWGPYGQEYLTYWIGDEDIMDMATEIIFNLEEEESEDS